MRTLSKKGKAQGRKKRYIVLTKEQGKKGDLAFLGPHCLFFTLISSDVTLPTVKLGFRRTFYLLRFFQGSLTHQF